MTTKGDAYAIATAIYPLEPTEFEERVFEVTDAVLGAGRDEAKADLYAQLAELLTATTPFKDAVSVIEHCLEQTRKRHGG